MMGGENWATLKLCDSRSAKEIKLVNTKYNFGRYEECDFAFTDNKYLSGVHCTIEYDPDKKRAWFIDNSTNGSLINLKLKIHKTKYLLANNDKIYLVYRRSEPDKNISYEFQYAKPIRFFDTTLSYEMEMPEDGEEDLRSAFNLDEQKVKALEALEKEIAKENEATSSKKLDDGVFKVPELPPLKSASKQSSSGPKKPALLHQPSSRLLKKQKSIDEDERTEVSKHKAADDEDDDDPVREGGSSKPVKRTKLDDDKEEPTPAVKTSKPYKDDTVEEKVPSLKSNKTSTDNDEKREKDEPKVEPKTSASSSSSRKQFEGFEDSLICSICNDIMHDCICLQPCLHSYCSGCYSEWMEMSDDCPLCRVKVTRISKSHIVNNLIETFLKNNPEMRRSEADIRELDSKNKITHDMLYPKKARRRANDDDMEFQTDSEEENDEDEVDEDDEYYDYEDRIRNALPVPAAPLYFNAPAGLPILNLGAAAYNQPFRFTCRQCPQNMHAHAGMVAPNHVCPTTQNHLLCQCCLEAMPDRSNDRARDPLIPKQNCSMCFKAFCDLYWGCRKGGCKRCLFKFSDMRVDNDCLSLLINGNNYESQLFSDWLTRKNKTVEQLFDECIEKLRSGTYKAGTLRPAETLDRVVCRACGLSLFSELAYQFRADIDDSELFNSASRRPDCHWGKNCRTQKHNLDHARRYNHICEQIKK